MTLPDAAPGSVDELAVELGRVVLEHDPLLATELGLHERNAELGEVSAGGLDAYERALRGLRRRIEALAPDGGDAALDRRGLAATVDSILASLEVERSRSRNPLAAPREATSGILFPLVWDHLPHDQREAAVAGRCRGLPAYLDGARRLLEPGVVPPLWARLGEATARGSATFLREVVPAAFPAAADDAEVAAAAMEAYAGWVADEVAPQAGGDYALGEPGLAHRLEHVHLLDETPAQVLARGRDLLAHHEALLVDAAGGRDWREALAEARADHPGHDQLVGAYRQELERLRRFCFDHDLVTDPQAPAVLEPTPEFLRPIMGYAAYLPPGAFDPVRTGKLWVTPPSDDAGLGDHSHAAMQPITAHEGYPGHHLQMTSVARLESVTRRLHEGTTLMVEGWGLYVEELMHEAGYYDSGGRLAQLALTQLRACRIVCDMGLHSGELSDDEAVDLLVDRAGISRATARSEVDRYTMTPTQPFTYLYGAEEIRRIRDAYRERTGASLRAFHDRLLTYGHLPPALVSEALLDGDA